MKEWQGSAGICLNEMGELLMVLQGTPEEEKTWSVPSGGKEIDETYEECCMREIAEETGYETEIIEKIKVKKEKYPEFDISVEVHYFLVNIIGGRRIIQDPDHLIHDIAWKSVHQLETLKLSFPEDKDFLRDYIKRHSTLRGKQSREQA